MTPLQELAVKAVASVPNGSVVIAVKALRDMDNWQNGHLRDYVAAVKWVHERSARKPPRLAPADKRWMVTELASRLSGISENRAYTDARFPRESGAVDMFDRRQRWLRLAIVRVAMIPTTEEN